MARDGQFLLDSKPFVIRSGEMHYARIPRAYWRDRLKMARAMGLNAITTYTFWNLHEPNPGIYDFSGEKDVAEFLREAQQEGLYVILRPGPYVCAEWDFGGFPAWLLKDHTTVVRSRDPKFLAAATRWLGHLGRELAPLQIGNGGPIIAVQVENEYGRFGDDHVYMDRIKDAFIKAGFTKSLLYTVDGADQLDRGALPELPAGITYGPGEAQSSLEKLKRFRSRGPYMTGEYWDGWHDHWGSKHVVTNDSQQVAEIEWILRHGYSFSLYMFHGGTSFGWMNGANSNGKNYEPDVTSYDYGAPLDESGRPTPKYFALRETIADVSGTQPPSMPLVPATIAVPAFRLSQAIPLWKTLPKPVYSATPLSMEDVGQAYGYILYRTELNGPVSGELVLDELHDYAQLYLDRKLVGTLDRRLGQSQLPLTVSGKKAELDILVENSGRVNYSIFLRGERKGITDRVLLNGQPVQGWRIYPLPMHAPESYPYQESKCTGACFFRGRFHLDETGDTFLDTSAFYKGMVWVNGHALGRIWSIGPQKTLYLPGPWLNKGDNEVVVFDLDAHGEGALLGRTTPVLDADVSPQM